jgi:hypothetical protein
MLIDGNLIKSTYQEDEKIKKNDNIDLTIEFNQKQNIDKPKEQII